MSSSHQSFLRRFYSPASFRAVLCRAFSIFIGAAALSASGASPQAVRLTPPLSDQPRIQGAKIFGARPGSPFLFTVAATGARPMTFSAQGLPAGLQLNPANGQITGVLAAPGEFHVTVGATNSLGKDERDFRIVCGDTIALTPPMGWNSWNCFGRDVCEADIRDAADALVSSGLANCGWTYINIDDGWAGKRDAAGNIQGDQHFPDIKALCDYVHSKGLKIGIYSSPGGWTCAGFTGSKGHEEADAKQYAAWGIDYLKYDLCSYHVKSESDQAENEAPYTLMNGYLKAQKRDILYSLCQYGWAHVSQWGGQAGGQMWRTTGDIWDAWDHGRTGSTNGMAEIGFAQNGLEKYAGPGHWNDPDMLVVGVVGWGKPRPSKLSPDEQYTHVSLWSLLAAPLIIGSDLTKLDDFTLGLLTNSEVIAIDQDPLGRQGWCVEKDGDRQIWVKPLEDGSMAVGLFNLGTKEQSISAAWSTLGLQGPQRVRDVWRNRDIGTQTGSYEATVAPHGVCLVRLIPGKGA